jgi:hypothetical protein
MTFGSGMTSGKHMILVQFGFEVPVRDAMKTAGTLNPMH